MEKIPALRPAFTKEGTVTAANASTINDGGAALVLMSREKAEELGIQPLGKIKSYADAAHEPRWFTTAPAKAIPKALDKAGLSKDDIDFFELNEAFSVVGLANMKILELDNENTDFINYSLIQKFTFILNPRNFQQTQNLGSFIKKSLEDS